jgi:hypothetical protein
MAESKTSGKARMCVMCGVPKEHCTGGNRQVSAGLRKTIKAHSSAIEAYNCMARYLVKQGYTAKPNREFHKEGEPVLVLTKKSRYGGALRGGKAGRSMPAKGGKKMRSGGLVI